MRRAGVHPFVFALVLVGSGALAAMIPIAGSAPLPGWPAGVRVERVRVLGAAPGAEAPARRALGLGSGAAPDSAAVVLACTRLLAAYEADGFLAAVVDSVVAGPALGTAADARAELRVHVTPGARATLARVTWDGMARLTPQEAGRISGLTPGAPFRPGALPAALSRVLAAYEARAFPAARLSVLEVDRVGSGVSLVLRAFEGDSIVVTEVTFPGAVATQAGVLRKSVQGTVGLPYDRARMRDARQRLIDLGIFARVDEPALEVLEGGRGRASFPVTEGAANAFDGALGFQGAGAAGGGGGGSSGGRITGLFDLSLGNLGGTARKAALRYEGKGGGVNEFRLRYAEPLLLGLDLRGELALDQLVEDTLYTRTRGSARFTFTAWNGTRAWIGLAAERTVLAAGEVERASASATEAGLEADRRDDPLRPRRGYAVALATGTAFKRERLRPADDGRRATQLTAWIRAQGHRPLGEASGLRLDLDGALRLSNEPVVPFYDLDPVGGARSLRGSREGQYRASRWAVARTEFGVFPGVGGRAFVFLDQGVLYRPFLGPDGRPASATTWVPGVGVGIEAPSGLGLVALSLGWGRGDAPLDGKLHVRLINRF